MPILYAKIACRIWTEREEMGIASRQSQKGAQITREWTRTLIVLSTWEETLQEKDKAYTMMSPIILEINQCQGA